MKVALLSYHAEAQKGHYSLAIKIGDVEHKIGASVEAMQINGQTLLVSNLEAGFGKKVQFNGAVLENTGKLVRKIYQGKDVELPYDLGVLH